MKGKNLVLITALMLCLPMLAHAQKDELSGEESTIRQIVQDYSDSWESGDIGKMRRVLHPQARLFLESRKSALVAQTPSQLYAIFKSNARHLRGIPPTPAGHLKIARIDVTGEIAAVKLEKDYPNSKVTEHLSLMKFEDGWKIVGRVLDVKLEQSQPKFE